MSEFTNEPADGPEERVRRRAYHLWEEAGRPEGQDAEFWRRASEMEVDGTGLAPADPSAPESLDASPVAPASVPPSAPASVARPR